MAEMISIQFFPKSALCSLTTRKFKPHDLWVSSAIVSPSPRFCLKSKYNSLPLCAAAVKAASSSSSEKIQREPMIPPYNVLITGGSKGIGYALAKEFLKAGDNVIICSRSDERVVSALDRLRVETGKQHVWGTRCDVKEGEDVKNLAAFSKQKLKYIDIWIHSKKRNRLELSRLNDLVYVKYNRTLRRRYEARDTIDPILLDNIDEANEWLTGAPQNHEDEEVYEGDDLDWDTVSMATRLEENIYGLRGSSSSYKGKGVASSSGRSLIDEESEDEEDDSQYNASIHEVVQFENLEEE